MKERKCCHLLSCAVALSALTALSLPVRAQAPPPPQNPSAGGKTPAPVIRTTTHLVQVNVIAEDKHGNPITGLTREDFRVLDNGEEQTVQFFSIENTDAPGRAGTSPPSALPANTWTNRFDRRSGIPLSVTLILLDGLNTRIQDQAPARQQVIKLIQQLKPQDRVAIYTLGTDLRVLHDFTHDASSLLAALARYQGHSGPEVNDSNPDDPDSGNLTLDDFIRGADQKVASFQKIIRATMTASALEAIANHVAGISGRKNLIWVSGGFPISIGYNDLSAGSFSTAEMRQFSPEIQRAARALNNADIAVYPVDARGLIGGMSASSRSVPGGNRSPVFSPQTTGQDEIATMNEFAVRTGGHAFFNTNDLYGAMRRAMDDSRVTYTLGFYPSHNSWNGKFRELKVSVKRGDVRLRFRSGYFALPDRSPDDAQKTAMLALAQSSPLSATAIGLTIHGDRTSTEKQDQLKLVVQVDPRDLSFVQEGDRQVSILAMAVIQGSPDGKVVTQDSKMLNLRLKEDSYRTVIAEGLSLTRILDLAPQTSMVRVVICDTRTGQAGSLDISVPGGPRVPTPKKR